MQMEYSFSTPRLSRSSKLKVSQANGGDGGRDGEGLAEVGDVEERLSGGFNQGLGSWGSWEWWEVYWAGQREEGGKRRLTLQTSVRLASGLA